MINPIAVCSAVAIFPTGLALWFLRPYRWFWIALSITAFLIAATGLLAVATYGLTAHLVLPRESRLEIAAASAGLRMLLAPPVAAAFALAGVIAADRVSRWSLLAAAGTEGAIAGYGVVHWYVGCCYI